MLASDSSPDGAGTAVRVRAARVIADVAYDGASLETALPRHAEGLADHDRALLRELCYGGLRWFWRGKGLVDRLVERPLRRKDRVVEAAIILGIYQLDRMRLPAHAAIHATVQACVALGRGGLKGLVNGVLRNFQRRREELLVSLLPAAGDAHPDWLWRAIHDQWPDNADAVIEVGNSRPPMTLRVNNRRASVTDYITELRAAGIGARSLDHAPQACLLEKAVEVDRLPGFREGRVSVQDASAQLLPALVQPDPGLRALDACAAPGGKLTHLLETFPALTVQAVEADPGRAVRIDENLRRLGLEAEVIVADAAEPEQWWDGRPFDLVVLDAPCSGTGVIRRHPDIKVLRRPSDPGDLAAVQARLLDGLWQIVAPHGRLVYVTCSILAPENQDMVEAFLRRTPDASEVPVDLPVGRALRHGWQILPGEGEGDGFYYAVLRRSASNPASVR